MIIDYIALWDISVKREPSWCVWINVFTFPFDSNALFMRGFLVYWLCQGVKLFDVLFQFNCFIDTIVHVKIFLNHIWFRWICVSRSPQLILLLHLVSQRQLSPYPKKSSPYGEFFCWFCSSIQFLHFRQSLSKQHKTRTVSTSSLNSVSSIRVAGAKRATTNINANVSLFLIGLFIHWADFDCTHFNYDWLIEIMPSFWW